MTASDVEAAERDRRRAQPEAHVVVAIDHRVLGVVGHDPEEIEQQEPPRDRRNGSRRTAAYAIGIPNENAIPRKACGSTKKRLKNG